MNVKVYLLIIFLGHAFEGFGENEEEIMEIWDLETNIMCTLTLNFMEHIVVLLDHV